MQQYLFESYTFQYILHGFKGITSSGLDYKGKWYMGFQQFANKSEDCSSNKQISAQPPYAALEVKVLSFVYISF